MQRNLALLTVFLFSFAFLSVVVGVIEIVLMAFEPNFEVTNDPKLMAGAISQELVSAAIILIASPFLAFLGCIVMLFNKYRARWYFYWSLLLTFPYVLFFPFGTCVFVVVWFFFLYKRKEFRSQDQIGIAI
ncbi:hypothetical protein LHL20_20705 [Alteromonas sp. McT4-15]|uniref:hypothetical protein n=1 Tax=Alteromonas sp. McT4-15 TaxID=2881256 RepID=UPI001CF916D3|nr:hypothetical protein [Alteromonas sp. McT4-15]MCB4438644.1 hypothetical protein [Alteromonas sp. McT4-15]